MSASDRQPVSAAEGPSIDQIAAARNSALGQQQKMTAPDSDKIAAELENAHKDALSIKAQHRDSDAVADQLQASHQQQEGDDQGGVLGAAKAAVQTVTNVFKGGADTNSGAGDRAASQQEAGDQGAVSGLLGSGRMIPTPVEPSGQRHLGDDEPDMPSAQEQEAMRAKLADQPASLGEGSSHSHGVGEVGAGANSVETAGRASQGLVDTVKGAMSSLFTGPSPPPAGTDAGAAVRETLGDLPMGDDTPSPNTAADTPPPDKASGATEAEYTARDTSAGTAAAEAAERAEATAEEPRAQERMGLPELLAQVVTNVAKNVGIATNQEEVLAGEMSPEPGVPEAPAGSAGAVMPGGAGDVRGAADEADDRAKEAADTVKDKAGDAVDAAKSKAASAADAATDAAGSAADSTRSATEEAKGAVGGAVDSAKGAAEEAKGAVGSAVDSAKDAVSGAVDTAKDKAQEAKDTVAGAVDTAKDKAQEAKDTVTGAVDSTKGAAEETKDRAAGALGSAQQRTQEAAEGAVDKAADTAKAVGEQVYGAADAAKGKSSEAAGAAKDRAGSAADEASGAAESVRDTAAGAYESAKDTAAGAYESVKDAASGAAGAAQDKASGAADAAKQAPSDVGDAGKRDQGESKGLLARAWEELTHGGGKAPRAVTQGETDAPQDVTSNQERSKHLDDPAQERIYSGEAYKVSPGSQASDAQRVTDQQRAKGEIGNVVAGDKRQVTGTVPHDKPEGPAPAAGSGGQPDRFRAGGGTYSGFGTGSAAPRRGNDDIKMVQALFYPPTEVDRERPMGGDSNRQRGPAAAAVEDAGDGRGRGAAVAADGDDDVDEEIPVSPVGLLGGVGSLWGRSWVAKAAGPRAERFRPADVPYDPEADARNDAEARAAYEHAQQTTYGRSGHRDPHGDTSRASASDAAKASREDLREAGKHASESAAYTRDAMAHGVDTAKRAAQEEAEAVREQVGKAVNTAQHKAYNAKEAARETVEGAANKTYESAEAAAESLRQQKESAKGAVRGAADAVRERAAHVAEDVRDETRHLAASGEDAATRARERLADTARSAEDAARRTGERMSETAQDARHRLHDRAEDARHYAHDAADAARHRARDVRDTVTADAERAVHEAEERRHKAGEVLREEALETKRAASGTFGSIGDAFKGLLSGLLSPFEREAAPMEERTTAVHAGTPLTRSSEPVPEEQMSTDEHIRLNAARHYAANEDKGKEWARDARARARGVEDEAAGFVGYMMESAHEAKEKAKGRAEELASKAREGYEQGEEKVKRAVDEGVDRASDVKERAAGVISRLEETLETVSRTVTDALTDFVEGDTKGVWTIPPSNTRDVLVMRQQKRAQEQGMDRQMDRMVSTLSDELRDAVEGRSNGYVRVLPPSNTQDVLLMRAQASANSKMDRNFF